MYGYTCAGSTNRIRNNNKRSLKCSWVFRPLYWSSWKLRPATVNVSPAVLVHSLGCGLQIKGYGHKKGGIGGGGSKCKNIAESVQITVSYGGSLCSSARFPAPLHPWPFAENPPQFRFPPFPLTRPTLIRDLLWKKCISTPGVAIWKRFAFQRTRWARRVLVSLVTNQTNNFRRARESSREITVVPCKTSV